MVGLVNTSLGYLFFINLQVTPFIVLIFLMIKREKVLNPTTDPQFTKLYGSLFSEFKNDRGPMSTIYYLLFFIRRVIYVTNLIFLRHMVALQFAINIFHWLLNLLFLLKYFPYTGRYTNFVTIYSELGTISVFSLWASYEFDYVDNTSLIVMWTAIGIVFSIMFFNIIDILIG